MKIIDRTLYQLTVPTPFAVGTVHMYLLKGDTLSLIDAGVKTQEAFEILKTQLKEIGYQPKDIEQIFLTHHHPDHTGLVEAFPRVKEVMGHNHLDVWLRKDQAYFERHDAFFLNFFKQCDIPERFLGIKKKLSYLLQYAGEGSLTTNLEEGDTLPGHPEWAVYDTKGHAQSHLSFYRKKDGVFIGGDHLLKQISSNPVIEAPIGKGELRAKPMVQYRENLYKCSGLEIKQLLPGHGEIFSNVSEVVQAHLQKQEKRALRVLNLLQASEKTVFQLCKQIFPHRYESQIDLTMSNIIGQLDYLENKGLVKKRNEGGKELYGATVGK